MHTNYTVQWSERASLPLPRAGCAVGVLGGKLIVVGGSYWQDGKKIWSDRADCFDPAQDAWSSVSALPAALADTVAVVQDDSLYLLGGSAQGNAVTTAWSYRDRQWTARPERALPAPRRSAMSAVIGQTLYIVGGFSGPGLDSATSTLWAGAPGKPWNTLTPLPGPKRFTPAVAAVGGRILVAGGATLVNGAVQNLDDILAYDPRDNRWSTLGRLPFACRAGWGVAGDAVFLMVGGYSIKFERSVLAIDPASGAVTAAGALPHDLADTRCVRMGSAFFVVSGECGDKVRAPWTLEGRVA